MLLDRVNRDVLDPMFRDLLPDFDGAQARVQLLAIGLQESKLIERVQLTNSGAPGPARGLWQNERNGMVRGVLTSRATRDYARAVCALRKVNPAPMSVWSRLAVDDILAAAFARLGLWADPRPLPPLGDGNAAWDCYIRNWQPGKPHHSTWGGNYARALEFIL